MSNLKYRLLAIAALVALSVFTLFPRTVVERVKRNGVFVTDTVRRFPLKRGLDLAGGIYVALDVDESKGAIANKGEALDRAIRVVRNRIDQFGVAEPVVQKAGDDRIIVELPGIDDPARAEALLGQAAFLEFQITDKTNALERSLPRLDAIAQARLGAAAPIVAGDTARRGSAVGGLLKSATDTATASADTAKASPAGAFTKAVQPAGAPGQYIVAESDYLRLQDLLNLQEIQAAMPPGKVLRWGADTVIVNGQAYRTLWALDARPIITGDYLQSARPSTDPVEGNTVQFEMSREGGRRFQNETGKHVKDYMAVVLDQRVITAPIIETAIGSRGQIRLGGGSLQAAQDLAIVLNAGALPVPLKIAETREIGPTLGRDSINQAITAGVVAIALVVVIMVGYYRFAGMLAVGGLVLYSLYTMATLAGFDAKLTLPGLAGFVLSIGIAVDANVLIFERIREELDHGKAIRTAIDEGFRHAMSAIIDSNVSTALTALVLYQYGTGPVRGFAVTLLAGIAASMISAIFVVRTFFLVWLNRSQRVESLSI